MSCVVPSLNLPVAVNCMVVPSPSFVSGVVRRMDDSLAVVTVRVGGAAGLVLPNFALITAVPFARVLVRPAEGFGATLVLPELQEVPGAEVTSWKLLSLNSAVAWNCTGTPIGSVGLAGVTTSVLIV